MHSPSGWLGVASLKLVTKRIYDTAPKNLLVTALVAGRLLAKGERSPFLICVAQVSLKLRVNVKCKLHLSAADILPLANILYIFP